jgi:uncharacterized protein
MKLVFEPGEAVYRIEQYVSGRHVIVNQHVYAHSLIVMPERIELWPPEDFEQVQTTHFDIFLALNPDCILFGTGTHFRIPDPALITPLLSGGIGVEAMDTAAACRTYALLISEGRQPAAALLI